MAKLILPPSECLSNDNAHYGLVGKCQFPTRSFFRFPVSLHCTHGDSPQGHFSTIPHKATLVSIDVCVCVCVCFVFINRRKRAAGDNGEQTNYNAERSDSEPVANVYITSGENVGPVPDGPVHANVTWPTPSNISLEMATDLCDGAIKGSPAYDRCFNLTVQDRIAYVNSCVADIQVTSSS